MTEPRKTIRVNFRAAQEAGKARQEEIFPTDHGATDCRGTFVHPRLGTLLDNARRLGMLQGQTYLVAEALCHCLKWQGKRGKGANTESVFGAFLRREEIADKGAISFKAIRRFLAEVCETIGVRVRRHRGPSYYSISVPDDVHPGCRSSSEMMGPTGADLDVHPRCRSPHRETLNRSASSSFCPPPPKSGRGPEARSFSGSSGALVSGRSPAARTPLGARGAITATATDAVAAGPAAVRIYGIPELRRLLEAAGCSSAEALQERLIGHASARAMPGRWLSAIEAAISEGVADPFEWGSRALRPGWGGVPPQDKRAEEIQALIEAEPVPAAEPAPEDETGEGRAG